MLTKYKEYILQRKFTTFGSTWFVIDDDMNKQAHFTLQEFNRYFMSKSEMRKLKLKKLDEKKV